MEAWYLLFQSWELEALYLFACTVNALYDNNIKSMPKWWVCLECLDLFSWGEDWQTCNTVWSTIQNIYVNFQKFRLIFLPGSGGKHTYRISEMMSMRSLFVFITMWHQCCREPLTGGAVPVPVLLKLVCITSTSPPTGRTVPVPVLLKLVCITSTSLRQVGQY